jgi:hypothetical protein
MASDTNNINSHTLYHDNNKLILNNKMQPFPFNLSKYARILERDKGKISSVNIMNSALTKSESMLVLD